MISKKLKLILALGTIFIVVGCSQQSKSETKKKEVNRIKVKKESKKVSSKTIPKKTNEVSSSDKNQVKTTLWNEGKDKKLDEFINKWAPTMNQSYEKYDGVTPIKTNPGTTYPEGLSNAMVDGRQTSIGLSKDGDGKYKYNVVAIYNYNKPRSQPPGTGHVTYFFTFNYGKPVVLVDQTTNGPVILRKSKNEQVIDAFNKIANNEQVAESKAESSNNDILREVTDDPRILGVLVREEFNPDYDKMPMKELYLSVYVSTNVYWIGTGTSSSNIGYTFDKNNVTYGYKYNGNKTISLKDIIAKYYSTESQKQFVKDKVAQMPPITVDYD